MVDLTKVVINVQCELVGRLSFLSVLANKTEMMNQMAVEGGLLSFNKGIMAINLHSLMIMRD